MVQDAESVRLAVVRWEDTTNIAAWSTPAEVEEFATDGAWICENVGWVLVDDSRCVVLAGRRTIDGEHVGLYERIPRQAVLAVTYLYQPPECDIPGCDHRRSNRGYDLQHSDGDE